jgi:cytochrome c553
VDARGRIQVPSADHYAAYVFRQLYAFKSGTRDGAYAALMKPIVANLSRRDMIDLAAYISSLTPWLASR